MGFGVGPQDCLDITQDRRAATPHRASLTMRGYSPGTVIQLQAMAGAVGRWMDARGIVVGDLDRAVIAEFRSARRASGMRWVPGAHGLDPLLEFLEQQGVVAVPARAGGPVEELVGRDRRWGVGWGRAVPSPAQPLRWRGGLVFLYHFC